MLENIILTKTSDFYRVKYLQIIIILYKSTTRFPITSFAQIIHIAVVTSISLEITYLEKYYIKRIIYN